MREIHAIKFEGDGETLSISVTQAGGRVHLNIAYGGQYISLPDVATFKALRDAVNFIAERGNYGEPRK